MCAVGIVCVHEHVTMCMHTSVTCTFTFHKRTCQRTRWDAHLLKKQAHSGFIQGLSVCPQSGICVHFSQGGVKTGWGGGWEGHGTSWGVGSVKKMLWRAWGVPSDCGLLPWPSPPRTMPPSCSWL